MIFAIATDEQTLQVFSDEGEAISSCEGIDVEAGIWLFWDHDGLPLFAAFTTPNRRGMFSVTNGTYCLIQNPEALQAPLLEALDHVEAVDGRPPLDSVEAIKRYLASRAPKP